MNKRLAITARRAIKERGGILWLDCYNDAIYEEFSPTIKTTTKSSEMNFVMEKETTTQCVGSFNNGQSGRVYDIEGVLPVIDASASEHGRGVQIIEPLVLGWVRNEKGEITDRRPIYEPTIAAMRDRDKDNPNDRGKSTDNYAQRLELKPDGTSNTLTSVAKDNLLIEPQWQDAVAVGRERTEEEKQRRHIHGDKGAKFSQGKQMCVTGDVSGCITTFATKDNLCAEKYNLLIPQATKEGYAVVPEGGVFDAGYPDSKTRRGRVQEGGTVSPTIMASQNELLRYEGIRIRRLTERELYRLMDVEEKDIDTLLNSDIARTQHSKLAGNSIVVACLYYIFKNLFTDTVEEGTQMQLF